MVKKSWNKSDLLPKIGSFRYKILLKTLEKDIKFVEKYKNKLKPSISVSEFMKIIKVMEKISIASKRIGKYSFLWYSENTSDQKSKSFLSHIEQLLTDLGNRIMFFGLWFKKLDEKNAKRIINGAPKEYKYYLESMRKTRKYVLTEPEEKIINIKEITGIETVVKIYEIITNSFTYDLPIKKKKGLTRDQLATYVKSPSAKVRKEAFQKLYEVYSKHADVLNEIYRAKILDWKNEYLGLRKFKSPISVMNISNDVSDKSVEALLKVCRKNRKVFQDYFKLKSKICKVKKMQRYDLYVPYHVKDQKFSYEESKKIVFDAYSKYSPKMAKLAKELVDKNHVNYEHRKGKRGGAYCVFGIPGVSIPYVLVNYDNRARDVFTMAHEFGHAVHDMLTHHHSVLTYDSPLVLAETASVFGEMLVAEKMMGEIKDKELKKSLLVMKLDDIYATVMRQSYFVMFEKKAHEMIAKGTDLDSLNKAYLENLKEQFGNSMKVNEEFKYEWISIPHIYETPFYCYSYAFGQLLVLALYEKYKKEGKKFVPKYLKLLSYGGSEKPAKVLKEVGIDIESEKFWQSGFDLIKDMVKELKSLS